MRPKEEEVVTQDHTAVLTYSRSLNVLQEMMKLLIKEVHGEDIRKKMYALS